MSTIGTRRSTTPLAAAVVLMAASQCIHAQDSNPQARPINTNDDPPPSMALLEFVALFETADGQWMDINEIPLSIEEQMRPQTDESDASKIDAAERQNDSTPEAQPSGMPANAF